MYEKEFSDIYVEWNLVLPLPTNQLSIDSALLGVGSGGGSSVGQGVGGVGGGGELQYAKTPIPMMIIFIYNYCNENLRTMLLSIDHPIKTISIFVSL